MLKKIVDHVHDGLFYLDEQHEAGTCKRSQDDFGSATIIGFLAVTTSMIPIFRRPPDVLHRKLVIRLAVCFT